MPPKNPCEYQQLICFVHKDVTRYCVRRLALNNEGEPFVPMYCFVLSTDTWEGQAGVVWRGWWGVANTLILPGKFIRVRGGRVKILSLYIQPPINTHTGISWKAAPSLPTSNRKM